MTKAAPLDNSTNTNYPHRILHEVFGFDEFRGEQEAVVQRAWVGLPNRW